MSSSNFGARNVRLDGIRGIAIALVIVHHAFQDIHGTNNLTSLIAHLADSCWVGVDLFFVLSGYLITGILLKSRDRVGYFRVFYMRRLLRIFPLYYCFLGGLLMIGFFKANLMAKMDFSWNFFYLSNVRVALHGWPWRPLGHLWSLSVEEQFYLVWPTVIFLMPRRRSFAAIVGLFCVFLAVRQGFGLTAAVHYNLVYCLLHLDGLLLGAALAALHQSWPTVANAHKGAWAALLLLSGVLAAVGLRDHGLIWRAWNGLQELNYSLVAACGAALIAVSIYSDAGALINRLLASRWLVEMGKYSYGIYIAHYPLDTVLRGLHLHPSSIFGTIPYAFFLGCAAVAAALATWTLIEERCINLKDRWFSYEAVPAADIAPQPPSPL